MTQQRLFCNGISKTFFFLKSFIIFHLCLYCVYILKWLLLHLTVTRTRSPICPCAQQRRCSRYASIPINARVYTGVPTPLQLWNMQDFQRNLAQHSAIIYQFFIWGKVIALWIIEAQKSQWKQKCNLLVLNICLILWSVLYKSCNVPCLYVNSFSTSFSAAPGAAAAAGSDRQGRTERIRNIPQRKCNCCINNTPVLMY